jgi:hypothetical protein
MMSTALSKLDAKRTCSPSKSLNLYKLTDDRAAGFRRRSAPITCTGTGVRLGHHDLLDTMNRPHGMTAPRAPSPICTDHLHRDRRPPGSPRSARHDEPAARDDRAAGSVADLHRSPAPGPGVRLGHHDLLDTMKRAARDDRAAGSVADLHRSPAPGPASAWVTTICSTR